MTLRARLHTGLWRLGVRHSHVLVLRCRPRTPPRAESALLALEDVGPDEDRIRELNVALERGLSDLALAARLRHGLRFFALHHEGGPIATAWVHCGGERFVEELGAGFTVPDDGRWLRDVFVAPPERGRGRFATLLDALRRRWPPGTALWSDVRHGNRPSLEAHRRYGFEVVGRYEAVHVLSRVLVRLRWSGEAAPLAFGGGGRLVRTGDDYRRFAETRRA